MYMYFVALTLIYFHPCKTAAVSLSLPHKTLLLASFLLGSNVLASTKSRFVQVNAKY